MPELKKLIQRASTSDFFKWVLNFVIPRAVPFNAPHHFKIVKINPGFVKVILPYRRSNLNHVRGIHACALATLCEYTIGITLLSMISEKEYRIILKNLSLEYLYQAKMDVTAEFFMNEETINNLIIEPLQKNDSVFHVFEINVFDLSGNHICKGSANWQIKKWNHVKMKL